MQEHVESLSITGLGCDVTMTSTPSLPHRQTSGELISSAVETHARRTATPGFTPTPETRLSVMSSSGLLRSFGLALFSERIRRECEKTHRGRGGDFEPSWSDVATLCCPSDSGPVALGLTTDGTGCSCLRNGSPKVFTPTASDWKGSTGRGSRRNTLAEQCAIAAGPNDGGTVYPHPEFVEAVMRFPASWTGCVASETPLIPSSPSGSEDR